MAREILTNEVVHDELMPRHFKLDKNACIGCHFVWSEGRGIGRSQLHRPVWEGCCENFARAKRII
jgi:hypothetical protein